MHKQGRISPPTSLGQVIILTPRLAYLTPGPSVVGNEANRYIRRPMDQGSSLVKLVLYPSDQPGIVRLT